MCHRPVTEVLKSAFEVDFEKKTEVKIEIEVEVENRSRNRNRSRLKKEVEEGKRAGTHCKVLWLVTEKQMSHFWRQRQSFTTESTKSPPSFRRYSNYIEVPPLFFTSTHSERIYSQLHIFLWRFMRKS